MSTSRASSRGVFRTTMARRQCGSSGSTPQRGRCRGRPFTSSAISGQILILRKSVSASVREHEAAVALMLWATLILGFFSISARQEYYGLPAVPALCLMAGGMLARADKSSAERLFERRRRGAVLLQWSIWFLAPLQSRLPRSAAASLSLRRTPSPGTTLSDLLANDRTLYNLSLGHIFDLTGAAMGLFRPPLIATTAGMLTIGLGSTLLR